MKKAILLALVSAAFCASADDQYLYWMISDGVTLGGQPITLGEGYSAKVKYVDGSTVDYLDLFWQDSTGTLNQLDGKVLPLSADSAVPSFAKIIDGLGTETSFFIELLNDAHVIGTSDSISYANIAPFIAAVDGMATPGSAFSISNFTPVPEPTSGLLMLVGLAGLALRRKLKKA